MSLTQIKPESSESCRDDGSTAAGLVDVLESEAGPIAEAEPSLRSWLSRPDMSGSLVRSLLGVLVGSLILRIASQTMGQMLQYYFADIDRNLFPISYNISGLITAAFFISELVGSLVLGGLSDRYGRKVFIYLGPLFGAVAVQLTSMTTTLWILFITRLLAGLSTASSIPAILSYISEVTSGRPKLRARIVGLFEITVFGGMAIGFVAGGKLFAVYGTGATIAGIRLTSPAFSINALIYVASLAVFVWGLKGLKEKTDSSSPLATARREIRRLRSLLGSRNVWRFAPAWIAINAIIGLLTNHSQRLMTGEHHFANQLLTGNIPSEKVGYGWAVLLILLAIGVLAWSFILGRYRRTSIMMIATGGLFITLTAVYGLNHLESFSSPVSYPLLGALVIGLLVLSAFTPAALTYLADVTETQASDRGSLMGLYTVFLGVGFLVGIGLGGVFATWQGIDGLLLLSAIFGLFTAWMLVLLRRQETPAAAI